MVMDHTNLATAPVNMGTHPSTNCPHDCLTLVINHEMLTPSCHSYPSTAGSHWVAFEKYVVFQKGRIVSIHLMNSKYVCIDVDRHETGLSPS